MKKKFCIITPDCGDRPEFLEHCFFQSANQTIKNVEHLLVSRPPIGLKPDLTYKIRSIWEVLRRDKKFTHIVIMENDDYYPDNWVETLMGYDFDLIGIESTYFYHLNFKRWNYFEHSGHSSLFCTAFKIEALLDYKWPKDDDLYLDINMWKNFYMRFTPLSVTKDVITIQPEQMPIGFKHGIGFCPGTHHTQKYEGEYKHDDSNLLWLSEHVKRKASLGFYKNQIEKLQYKRLKLIKPQ